MKRWVILALGSWMLLTGCSHFHSEKVKPWQRGTLARQDMQLVPHPQQNALEEHLYFSKEAPSGGFGVGGGGCGCN